MVRDLTNSRAGGMIAYFATHKTAANLLLVVLLVLGLAAAPQMRAQYFPDVVLDEIRVTVNWDDAGPDDVDRAIVAPLLPALQAVEGVAKASSTSSEGRASISLEFEPNWDMSRALSEVETATAAVTDLPDDADLPEVTRRAWRDRVTDVVLTGPVEVSQLARFADDLVLRLFDVGVTRTTIRGIAAPLTTVEVQTADLIRHDISLSDIATAVEEEATTDPAGNIDAANARLRSGSARRSAEDIAAVVLRSSVDGSTLRVGDVAQVIVGEVDRNVAYYVNEDPALSIRVDRSAQGDAIDMQNTVEDVAAELMTTLPPGVNVELIRTRSEAITGRLNILMENGLMGLGLVLALLFLFLNARTALWVAAGIPVAMLAAVAIMYAFGLSLNMISIFGLIITLGIVVDDAIVVGEHADFRARSLGESPEAAAVNAARRMALPVFSATITTIIAFWALTLIGGRFGTLIRDIPVTVVAVLAASLVECFVILPNHMRHALANVHHEAWYDWPSRQVNKGLQWFSTRLFRPFILLVIKARYPVISLALLILSTQAVLFISDEVRWRFFNGPEQGSISGNFAMAPGATRNDTVAQMREMQRAAEVVGARYEAEYGTNPLDYVLAQIGGTTGRGLAGADTKDTDLLGSIAIELIDADLRPYSSFEFLAALQDEATNHPLAETVSFRGWRSGPGGDSLDVKLYGAETLQLKEAAEAIKRAVAVFPEVSAVEDTMAWDKEDLILDLTPQARVLGLSIDDVGRVLRDRLNGVEAARYADGPRSASIRVEVPDAEKTADFLERVVIRAPMGQYVPLADLVTVERQPGFSTIRRENGLRVISVTGDISEDDPAAAEAVIASLQTEILPEIESRYQVGWELSGLAEQENDFLADASTGFTLCLLGIFLTLAWIFSSWTRPLVIMAIIPFGLVGTIWGHYIWEIPMSIFTVIGLIGMTGIIINDSIVLITTVDEYSKTRGLKPAIVDAVTDRLRPVLLTTLTTVLGLAPLLYESSRQAQFLKPTVVTLVYGLGFGMLLVLIVVPALLATGQDVQQSFRAARRAFSAGSRGGIGRAASAGLACLLAGWFVVTMGAEIVTGQMLLPIHGEGILGAGLWLSFVVFALGAVVATAAIWVLALAVLLFRGKKQLETA